MSQREGTAGYTGLECTMQSLNNSDRALPLPFKYAEQVAVFLELCCTLLISAAWWRGGSKHVNAAETFTVKYYLIGDCADFCSVVEGVF